MKPTTLAPLTLALASLLFASCRSSSETGALAPQNTTKFDTELKERFVLMDPGTQQSVTCMGLQQTTLADGRLQVAALVRNRENRRIEVQIQCEFKDTNGFAVDSPSWEVLILTENATETKNFTSLTDQAKRYTVRVRQSR